MATSSSPEPTERWRRLTAWIVAHGRALWIVALLLAVPATYRTAMLYAHLKSDVEALLPRDAPSVRAVDELRARMPGLQYLGVVVDTGSAQNLAAGERFIDDLAARIQAYPPELVRRVRVGSAEEKAFLEKNAALYLSLDDLGEIKSRIEKRRDYEIAKESGNLIDDDDGPPPLEFGDIKAKYEDKLGGGRAKTSETSRFSSAEKHLTMLLVEVAEFETGRGRSGDLFARVKADVAALGGPEKYAVGMRAGYTGDVAISVEETDALMADLSLSSVLVIALSVLVVVVYYQWWRSVVVLLVPLLLSALYAFGVASLPPFSVHELNSNTAFLGSIVVGNGINFGIILIARYVEERRAGKSPMEAMTIAHFGTRAGTIAAACAAGTSYAALSLTEFQGFHQFGYIGGVGMALSWLAAYLLMPSLTLWLDRDESTKPRPVKDAQKPMTFLARFVMRAPVAIVIASVLLTGVSVYKVRSFSAASLEYDFSKLRRKDTWQSGEGYWGARMDDLLGTYLTPIVILTDSPKEADAVSARLREAIKTPPLADLVSSIRTAADVIPTEQPAKIERARELRELMTPNMRSLVPKERKADLDRFMGQDDLKVLTVADLPVTFTTGMRERDGSIDKSVLVYPKPSHALWEGPAIQDLVASLREAGKSGTARPARVGGSLPVSADILGSIRHDGPIASAAAFGLVVLVVLALFRLGFTSGVVLTSLLLGVLWLAGATILLGVKINFANFIAFPITFGIGVDYAVNVMTRYASDGRGDIGAAIRSTGGAVGLCSLTTIIGYSSLLLAENRALFLFGVLAVLGEFTCLAAALFALPAALTLWKRRRGAVPASSAP